MKKTTAIGATVCTAVLATAAAPAIASPEDLAKQLSNPIAALIQVPIQYNWDTGIGSADANRSITNIQPVVPFSVGKDLNLISRTILPVIKAESPVPGGSTQSGLGDVVQSLFLGPKDPTASGWIWGAGPVFLLPTATNDALATKKWGLGPTAVALKQQDGWTYGALFNHIWSVAGDDARPDISATFLQPFVGFTFKTMTTLTATVESTYDWEARQWTVPLNLVASQVLKVGDMPLSVALGYRSYLDAPAGGPKWGVRFVVSFLFPR